MEHPHCFVSVHNRAGSRSIHHGIPGAGLQGPRARTRLPAFVANRFCISVVRAFAAALSPGASGTMFRGDDDTPSNLADGYFRIRVSVVFDGGFAARTLV